MSYSEEISKVIAEGSRLYSSKNYDSASEKYGEACEKYSEQNGKEDANLLLLYGKALFQSAVSKSEVFGGNPGATTNEEGDNGEDNGKKDEEDDGEEDGKFQFYDAAPLAEEEVEGEAEGEGPVPAEEDDDEDEEDEEEKEALTTNGNGQEEEGDGQDQSDFEVAWEILDLARSLFEEQLEELGDKKLKPPYLQSDKEETSNEFIIITKKLSETYDLLGEVSLEAENFPQSAIDLENCLNLRLKLYNPINSALISESHYKLSLALEFCVEDPKSKGKAVEQMKLAIESVKRRNENETDEDKRKDNEELLNDLKLRYQELQRDETEAFKAEQVDIIKGILGEATSDNGSSSTPSANSSAAVINTLTGVKKKTPASAVPVNDLTSITKKRKPTDKTAGINKKSKQ
ncbi:uncharacterized protein RJT21DRAFT_122517 [Scheffersomyces amazonensis]|uniref:uncharacterized protein n=1 Tax=Scheffersomyces amazonensis TaxID=1078765 RepID=UPI00315C5A4D